MENRFRVWTGGDKAINIAVQNVFLSNGYTWFANGKNIANMQAAYYCIYVKGKEISYGESKRDFNGQGVELSVLDVMHYPDLQKLLEES